MNNDSFVTRKIIPVLICVLVAVLSIRFFSPFFSDAQRNADKLAAIDEKIETVMDLTGAATVSSAVISLLPDDTGTPIANKLADFSTYFLLVLCVLYLEKYLLTILGYIAFTWLLPVACGFFAASLFVMKKTLRQISARLAVFALVIAFVIPAGLVVSDMVYATYETSIETTISAAKENSTEEDSESTADSGEKTLLQKLAEAGSSLTTSASELKEMAATILNRFIEALAVMIVTSCLIPLLVLALFLWAAKLLLGINISPVLPVGPAARLPGSDAL